MKAEQPWECFGEENKRSSELDVRGTREWDGEFSRERETT